MSLPPSVPAGWYPDPSSDRRLRWWDGTGWTAPVLDNPRARKRRSWGARWRSAATGWVLAVVVLANAAGILSGPWTAPRWDTHSCPVGWTLNPVAVGLWGLAAALTAAGVVVARRERRRRPADRMVVVCQIVAVIAVTTAPPLLFLSPFTCGL